MSRNVLVAGAVALGLSLAASAYAQTTTAPTTSPPERMNGSTTTNNPATATTPPPGTNATTGSDTSSQPAVATSSATTPGAPHPGANSFTEGEARSRIEKSGYGQVADLKLDQQGIWRGTANKDGKSVSVALDYQGNVTAQ